MPKFLRKNLLKAKIFPKKVANQNILTSKAVLPGLLLFVVLAFSVANSSEAMHKNVVAKTSISKPAHWKAYNLADEGSYVLRLNNLADKPVASLLKEINVYIPATSFVKDHEHYAKQIFVPSSGEYLVQVNLLKLLREEGLNVSLRSHSFVYVVLQKPTNIDLEVYKIGPAKPLLSQAL
jgi:hypothetical protein